MSDARAFTDYRSSCRTNAQFRINNNISSSHEYRMFLTSNAVNIMNLNSSSAWNINGCGTCKNICLVTDQTARPGNSSPADFSQCISPADYLRYNGAIPVKGAVLKRYTTPGGGTYTSEENTQYTSNPANLKI
jgi:hypothetical protein